MQLSQLFRRGVIVPLTESTAEQLTRWSVDDFARVEYIPIVSQALFEDICEAGVFRVLNRACSANIGDYEEEELKQGLLAHGITALVACRDGITVPAVASFVDCLIGALKTARQQQRSVYFIL
jgi:hypothetical protein